MRRLLVLIKNLISLPMRLSSHISLFAILQGSDVDKTAAVSSGARFYRSKLGKYSYIGRNCFIESTEIGNFCSIAPSCEIGGASHPLNWVSTSPVFYKWENIMKKNFSRHEFEIFEKTTIGNDVWIATNCLIKAGVNIADGAVVGMGSVVVKDIGAYEIWAGNPARIIRKRFDDETIENLLEIRWWNKEDVSEFASYMTDVDEYIQYMKGAL